MFNACAVSNPELPAALARIERCACDALVQRIPAGRLGQPEDLAGAALLLCSDAGAYINGINLYVDGGRSIA